MAKCKVIDRQTSRLSDWVTLVEKTVIGGFDQPPQKYHSLKQADYVSLLAITEDGQVPLVRQYRPALESYTLELPGGLLESGEDPAKRAAEELYEETGYQTKEPLTLLATLDPDTGRLENRLWCFFATGVSVNNKSDWSPENGVEVLMRSWDELIQMVNSGEFRHALHIAIIGMAITKGYMSAPSLIRINV